MTAKRNILLLACVGALTMCGTGPGDRPPKVSSRDFLLHHEAEEPGYRLYSYVLFGSRPNKSTRPRYLKAIKAYLGDIEDVNDMLQYFNRKQLNITYLPVDTCPDPKYERNPKWLLLIFA